MITTECRLLFVRHAEELTSPRAEIVQEMLSLDQVREIRNGLGGLGLEVELIDGRILRVHGSIRVVQF